MFDEITNSLILIVQQTQLNLYILGTLVALMWGVFCLSLIIPQLLWLGIIPRTLRGLPGIVFAPLLHGNFNHLFFNTIPLVVLSNFLLINGLDSFLLITAILTVSSGFLLWCFGKSGLHIGASGLITGYWAFLVSNSYQQGTVTAVLLGLISVYYFAGIFFGIFPTRKGVSWEGHLFGLLSGLGLSYSLHAGLVP